jgi:alanyl-tRNA synthetase
VPAAIDKLRRDADTSSATITALRGQLATAIAAAFPGTGTVVAAIPGDGELLRSVAAKLTAAGRDAILATADDDAPTVVLLRAPGSTLDCGALWKKLTASAGGRGGGKAEQAQGRLGQKIADWPALVASLLAS